MRLTHLDILEHCFHEKFRGYDKEEVETFLHLVADDFKSMAEEIKSLKKNIAQKEKLIKQLKDSGGAGEDPGFPTKAVKEKAQQIIDSAKRQAGAKMKKAEEDLILLKKEIQKLKVDKNHLIESIKSGAKKYLESIGKKS